MLKVTEIAFCCYAVTDMPRARVFYEGMLGLKPTTVSDMPGGKWVEYRVRPIRAGHRLVTGLDPKSDGCSAALEVEDFDALSRTFAPTA